MGGGGGTIYDIIAPVSPIAKWGRDQEKKKEDKASEAAAQAAQALELDKEKEKTKQASMVRANLFKTSGGYAGEEIMSGQTSQRSSIFGNA